jgi:hypothetical protein
MHQDHGTTKEQSASCLVAALEGWLSDAARSSEATRQLIACIGRLCVSVTAPPQHKPVETVDLLGVVEPDEGCKADPEAGLEESKAIEGSGEVEGGIDIHEVAKNLTIGNEIKAPSEPRKVESQVERKPGASPFDASIQPYMNCGAVGDGSVDWAERSESVQLKARVCAFFEGNHRAHHNFRDEHWAFEEADKNRSSFFEQARGLNPCYLWMCNQDISISAPLSVDEWRRCKLHYQNLGATIELIKKFEAHQRFGRPIGQEIGQKILQAIATTQSALRHFLSGRVGLDRLDEDQDFVFRWLDARSTELGWYVDRHMKMRDPADHTDFEKHGVELKKLNGRLDELSNLRSRRKKLEKKVQWHAMSYRDGGLDSHDWNKICESLLELQKVHGVSAKDILPHDFQFDQLQYEADSRGIVFGDVDSQCEISSGEEECEHSKSICSEAVLNAKRRLAGRGIQIFGGVKNQQSQESIARAFDCTVEWRSGGQQKSIKKREIERIVARAAKDGNIFVLTRWRSHKEQGVAQDSCRKHGVPLIFLEGGYSPTRLAHDICTSRDRFLEKSLDGTSEAPMASCIDGEMEWRIAGC